MKPIKIKIEDVEYTCEIPLYRFPMITYFREKFGEIPKTIQEAEKLGEELKRCYEELKRYIRPEPPEDHFLPLLVKYDAEAAKIFLKAFQAGNFTGKTENPLSK